MVFKWGFVFILWVFLVFSFNAHAKTNRFSVTKNSSAMGRDGFFSTMGSQPLYQNEITFNSSFDYSYRPLQLNNGSSRFQGVVDHLLVQQLGVAYAPLNWFQFDVLVPVVLVNQYTSPSSATDKSNQSGIGDVTLNGHFRLLPRDTYKVGVSLIPTVTFPTGNENHFVADTNVHGGMLVCVDVDITDKLYAAFNFGFSINEEVDFVDFVRDDQFLMSAGLSYHFTDDFEVMSEVTASTKLDSPYTNKETSSVEAMGGLKYKFKKSGIAAQVGAGVSVLQSVGSPTYRVFGGLSYTGNFIKGKQAKNKSKVKERDLQAKL